MTIVADDFQYSTTSSGKQIKYGEAGDCYSASKENCRKGKFKIDLTGTGFRLKVSLKTTLFPTHSTWYYTSLISELTSRIVLVTVVGLVSEDGK